jgi:hypothetical protein
MRRLNLLLLVGVLLVAGCGSPLGPGGGGGGIACTEIGCVNGVTVAVTGVGLDAKGGRIVAEMCFDGGCQETRYVQQPDGASRSSNPAVQLFASPDAVEVMFQLPEGDYDEDTGHEVSLVLRVAGGEPIRLQRTVNLERSQPNGPDCPPVCWQARIEHAA